VERACGGGRGRGTFAVDAHRQAYQRRVSLRSLNPAGQHHDAGAGPGRDAACATRTGFRRQRLIADSGNGPRVGGGQEATETQAPADTSAGTGANRARCATAAARRRQQLILSKAVADR
jgi:hypothetical protein